MRIVRRGQIVAAALVGVLSLSYVSQSQAGALLGGDLVVTRALGGTTGADETLVGAPGSAALSGSGVTGAVYLDEYSAASGFTSVDNTVVMPYNSTMVTGSNHVLTFSGTQNTEGAVSLSSDGRFLVLGGYNQSAFVTGVNSNGSAANIVNRVVGLVDMNGNVNTTTALADASSAQAFRSVFSTNGTDIWVNGANGGAIAGNSTAGIRYTTVGSTTSTQVQALSAGGARALKGFNGQLFIGNTGTPAGNRGVNGVDTNYAGITAPGATITQLPGFSTTADQTDGFWFKDANTLYTADIRTDANGGIRKYVFTDTDSNGSPDTWVFQYVLQLGVTGTVAPNANNGGVVAAHALTGMVDGSGNTELFATSFEAGGGQNRLWELTDGGSAAASSQTLLALSGTNSAFRGVEFLPVPEPGTFALLGMGALGMIRRRRVRLNGLNAGVGAAQTLRS